MRVESRGAARAFDPYGGNPRPLRARPSLWQQGRGVMSDAAPIRPELQPGPPAARSVRLRSGGDAGSRLVIRTAAGGRLFRCAAGGRAGPGCGRVT